MNLKRMIIILSILTLLLIFILIFWLNYQAKLVKEDLETFPEVSDMQIDIAKTLQPVKNRNNFYTIKTCIGKFYTYYSDIFKNVTDGYLIEPEPGSINEEKIKNDRANKVYKLLDEEYISYKGITVDNLGMKLPEVGDITININNMYFIEKEDAIAIYVAYGNKEDSLTSELTDFSIMLKVDMANKTYKVLLEDYIDTYYKDLKIGNTIEIKDEEIKNDTYNIFSLRTVTDQEYVNDLFKNYKDNLKASKEQAYNLLDEEYKDKCFDNKEDYLSYVSTNYSRIVTAKLDTYNKEEKGEHIQYLFKDINENYYVFKETAPFQYTVMLDNYTIPTDDFIKEYNSSTEVEKVILNIKRFFMGIDDKNYGYSYSVLSEAFRNNKYQTKADFVNYAKQNFFEENEIEYTSYEKENGLYIYKIKIKDATGKSSEVREFNMILKLNSGTDFEMSFGN